jgi:hypothetical protein
MEGSMQWCLDLHLSSGEKQLPAYDEYYASSARIMALANDFFSWETEKNEPTDRPRNAVPIIMKQYSMAELDAKVFLKGMVVEA